MRGATAGPRSGKRRGKNPYDHTASGKDYISIQLTSSCVAAASPGADILPDSSECLLGTGGPSGIEAPAGD